MIYYLIIGGYTVLVSSILYLRPDEETIKEVLFIL